MRMTYVAATALLLGLNSAAVAGLNQEPSCCAPAPVCASCNEMPACGTCQPVPECQGCMTSSCPCEMAGCEVCSGNGMCWDCSLEEGVDVDSLTPAAQSKQLYLASQARITMLVPAKAGVTLLDQKMSMPGVKRTYVVPVPDQTKDYKYEIKVDVVSNGKKYFKRVKIPKFRAGMILAVKVDAPPAEEGEAPQILVEPAVVAEGGKPPEDTEE